MQNRLRELRLDKGLTQASIAKALGVTRQAISLYEQGRREMKLETLKKIADFFHVPTEYLLGITNDRVTLTVNDLNPAEEDAYKRITAMLSEDYPKGSISKNKIGRLLADEGLWEE